MHSSRIGSNIAKLRESKGWSKKHLSIISEVSATYIGELESGKKNPTVAILNKIAYALGVSTEELIKNTMN